MKRAAVVVLLLALLPGCGGEGEPTGPAASTAAAPTSAAPTSAAPTSPAGEAQTGARRGPRRLRGIDASHHKGPIDWEAVAADGIAFAYLKASEGSGFVDPRFDEHRREALAAGLRVGGYHYFQLCTPGAEQAEHFASVLGELRPRELPPALDLELAGSCSTPPPRAELLAEVRAFLELLEARTGRRTVVYLYPELEDRYGFAGEVERPQWVRRLGDVPPDRPWWIWQRSQTGSVAGVTGEVDLNVMKVR